MTRIAGTVDVTRTVIVGCSATPMAALPLGCTTDTDGRMGTIESGCLAVVSDGAADGAGTVKVDTALAGLYVERSGTVRNVDGTVEPGVTTTVSVDVVEIVTRPGSEAAGTLDVVAAAAG